MSLQIMIFLGLIILFFLVFMFIVIRKLRSAAAINTTAQMTKIMNSQNQSGNQIYSRAKEYAIESALNEIKRNTNELKMKKDEILILMQDLKVTMAKNDIKDEPKIQTLIQELKLQFVDLQNKTQSITAEPIIKKYIEEEQKIMPEPRINHAKKMGLASRETISEIKKTTAEDKKFYHYAVMSLLALPKETNAFLAYLEKKLAVLEKKFEGSHGHKDKDLLKKIAHSLDKVTEKKSLHEESKEEKSHTHTRKPR